MSIICIDSYAKRQWQTTPNFLYTRHCKKISLTFGVDNFEKNWFLFETSEIFANFSGIESPRMMGFYLKLWICSLTYWRENSQQWWNFIWNFGNFSLLLVEKCSGYDKILPQMSIIFSIDSYAKRQSQTIPNFLYPHHCKKISLTFGKENFEINGSKMKLFRSDFVRKYLRKY